MTTMDVGGCNLLSPFKINLVCRKSVLVVQCTLISPFINRKINNISSSQNVECPNITSIQCAIV